MAEDINSLTGVVLCGGRGSRMGGINKGLVAYKGRRLFEFAQDNLSSLAVQVVINTNTEKETYRGLGFTLIDDADYLFQGPLAGIYAGLSYADTNFVAFAPCDQLTLPKAVYQTLLQRARETGAAYAISNNDIHPTCCVVATRLAASVRQSLDKRELKLRSWMKNNASAVPFDGIEFSNINQLP